MRRSVLFAGVAVGLSLSLVLYGSSSLGEPGTTTNRAEGNVTVHFIDIGQGDATLVTYENWTVLIDSGDRYTAQKEKMQGYLAGLNVTHISLAIATHADADHIGQFTNPVSATLTSVGENSMTPVNYELSQNYPNPFNPETSIKFSLKNAGRVTLIIYNSTGQIVKTLIDQDMSAGNHNISFIADGMTSGVYIYRINVTSGEGNQFQAVRKMILMK